MGAKHDEIDLAYRLLDLDLVDSDGRRCGKVDDIVLSGEPGELTYVATIRTGPGALPERFIRRLQRPARRLFGDAYTDIPWRLVEDFDATVTLTETADAVGLAEGDLRLAALFGGRGGT